MLYAYNKTLGALPLPTASPVVTLPIATAAPSLGARGEAFDVTDELTNLTPTQYANIQAKVADGSVEFEWTTLPEFNTYTLVVGAPASDIAENDVLIYVSVSGNDANPGTQALPLQTFGEALRRLPSVWKKRCQINIADGVYTFDVDQTQLNVGGQIGPLSSPLAIVGGYTNEVGLRTATATDPAGATASTAAGAPAGQLRFTGLAGVPSAAKGQLITISGAASLANNGNWQVTSVISPTEIYVQNPNGVAPDVNNGAITWSFGQGVFITLGGAPLVAEAWEGFWISCLSGACAGYRGQIVTNDTQTVCTQGMSVFLGTILPGDTFVIERCSVSIDTGSGTILHGGRIGTKGIRWIMNGGNVIRNAYWGSEGCEYDMSGGALTIQAGGIFESALFLAFEGGWAQSENNPFDFFTRLSAGSFFYGGPVTVEVGDMHPAVWMAKNASMEFFACTVGITLIAHINAPIFAAQITQLSIDHLFGAFGRNIFRDCPDVALLADRSHLIVSNASVYDNGGDAIKGTNDATVNLVDVSGTDNVGVGLNVQANSHGSHEPGTVLVTGVAGDAQVGATNHPPGSWTSAPLSTVGSLDVLNRIAPAGV